MEFQATTFYSTYFLFEMIRKGYSSGPNNSVVLNKCVQFFIGEYMILGKSKFLLVEKMHVIGIFWCE